MRAADVALTVLASARLSRLVIVDQIGQWWVKDPVDRAMDGYVARAEEIEHAGGPPAREPWWWKYRSGLDCPWCVGFWLGAAVLLAHRVLPRPLWRAAVAPLALNYAAAHLGGALGDYAGDDDAEEAQQ